MPGTQTLVKELVTKLKKRRVEGSQETALLTAELLRSVISQLKVPPTNQAETLIEAVKSVGELLVAANPVELAVGNIVRRVLHIIRDEDFSVAISSAGGDDRETAEQNGFQVQTVAAGPPSRSPSLHAILDRTPDSERAHHSSRDGDSFEGKGKSVDRNAESWKLKHDVIRAVNELIEGINSCHQQIAEQSVELIHQNEILLTFGRSRTVREFLCAAKEKRRSFRVFVAEGAPKYRGHALAEDLGARGLQTTVITDSAVLAMISRVNMVVVGVHAVMANGGVIGPVGLNMVALAARKHAVPFVVVAGPHKLCPLYPQNPQVLLNEMRCPSELLQDGEFSDCMGVCNGIWQLCPLYPQNPQVLLNEMRCPSELLQDGEFSDCMGVCNGSGNPRLNFVNPAFDYVPPELVSLFITEIGGYNPSFVHRLIADYYSADDLDLQKRTTS